jgi:hypothetical protein
VPAGTSKAAAVRAAPSTTQYRYVIGLRGDLNDNWNYDFAMQYGRVEFQSLSTASSAPAGSTTPERRERERRTTLRFRGHRFRTRLACPTTSSSSASVPRATGLSGDPVHLVG